MNPISGTFRKSSEGPRADREAFLRFLEDDKETFELFMVTDEELNQRLEEIRTLIEDSIEPDSWDAVGGRGTIRYFNRTLVVRNSVEVHEQIAGYFALGR